ncbi:hypothetical protein FDECE_4093 [Fusarium decemcellulare]|nr:hypothetical protein FDECE_4093 [Fusarium decemcellulare]
MDFNSPDAQQQGQPHTPQQNSNPTAASRSPRVLACVLCQQRKIKCDRNFPCSNCIKASVVCTPSTPAPARKRRRPNQVLQERLTKLEALLDQYSAAGPPPQTDETPQEASGASSAPSPMPPSATSDSPLPAGKIVVEDGSVKFMDSYLWGIIHENLKEMRQVIEAETPEDSQDLLSPDTTRIDDEHVDLLLNGISSMQLDDLVPLPVHVFRLWQIFVERVNPLTKLVHVPTLQPVVIEAVTNHMNVSKNSQALLFAIYLSSVVSMTDKECRTMLDMPRDEALGRFTKGVKAALTKSNFLVNYDMVTLQALVLYLICLQGRSNHDAVWVLSGVVIRIAHKMGLHRDGDTLGLSPFEAEMRRRVWWQIITLDSTYASTSGLRDTTLLPSSWDTKAPHNIDDADFSPRSTEIQSHDGPTEMAFCLILYELIRFIKDNPAHDLEHVVLGGQGAEPGTAEYNACIASLNRFQAVMDDLDVKLTNIEEQFCDPTAGPVHTMACGVRPSIISEVRHMLTPMRETPEWGTEVNNVQDNLFRIWLSHHEAMMTCYDRCCNGPFLWFNKCHFQLDAIMFLVNLLINRSQVGTLADRCWLLIDRVYYYHDELWNMNKKQHTQLGCFVLKAWKIREETLTHLKASFDIPACVLKLKTRIVQSGMGSTSREWSPPIPPEMEPHRHSTAPDMQLDLGGPLQDPLPTDWELLGDPNNTNNQNLPVFGFLGNYGQWAPGPNW